MLTRPKFVLISIFSIIFMLSSINSFQSIIAGYVCFIIYALIIGVMSYQRIKYNRKKSFVEQKETEEKYKKYKSEENN